MLPYTQVHKGEMFLTYAESEDEARAAFADHGLPETDTVRLKPKARVRVQPARKASAFKYTLDGETVTATVVGHIPPDFQDYDPADVSITIGGVEAGAPVDGGWSEVETPDVLNA